MPFDIMVLDIEPPIIMRVAEPALGRERRGVSAADWMMGIVRENGRRESEDCSDRQGPEEGIHIILSHGPVLEIG
ncbi:MULTISPECIES: hypothetical protein [unclassified Mesorhizobium]|uniref:hypothetical protein n=1 Tax=unclassified Mesorhizobium TaxID=325217 RepID=UPI000FDA9E99|nr:MULTISPECIES: hypothetical protein [unclassified Mesorhizobium]TGQ07499.1 hypothetical protein EN862_023055 [Mesorhizobium sp. M2E.F.Ca.ET.219.01.1.1]TGT74187.1 hypothetical protein EN809_015425 [Mesorhizobium sp. M2E.F.Ca.ET.166.01.1.1]TGW00701.1 hypothetical protein EN797_021605 [Mesorhizobium sp. M2E.F.Ca.ET.154.01.1.1]